MLRSIPVYWVTVAQIYVVEIIRGLQNYCDRQSLGSLQIKATKAQFYALLFNHVFNTHLEPASKLRKVTWLKIELADSIDKNDHHPTDPLHKKGSVSPYPMKGVRLRQGLTGILRGGFYSIAHRGDLTNKEYE